MSELFVKVEWPEIQDFQTEEFEERFDTEISYSAEENVWFIPLSFYNEVYKVKTLIIGKKADSKVMMYELSDIADEIENGREKGYTNNTNWELI